MQLRPIACRALLCSTLLAAAGFVFAVSASSTRSAAADHHEEAPAPRWWLVSVADVKPEMRLEWKGLQKRQVNPALKKGGVSMRVVWETVLGDTRRYISAQPLKSFASLGEDGPLRRALAADERLVLLRQLSKCLDGRTRYAVLERPDLSILAEGGVTQPYAVRVHVSVVPGKQAAYEKLMKDEVLPGLKRGGVERLFAGQTIFGGNTNGWVFYLLLPSLGGLDHPPPLVRALGREGAQQLQSKFSGLADTISYSVVKVNQDLTFTP